MDFTSSQLGHFLKYKYWEDALALVNCQIDQIGKNQHFHTLSLFYYESLETEIGKLQTEEYFNIRVASNLFYAMSNDFKVLPYLTPKNSTVTRNYKFFTYPMRLIYYAVVIYLVELTSGFLQEYKQPNIESRYGGDLRFQGGRLIVQPDKIYYYNYYMNFERLVHDEIKRNTENKVVLRLDIKDFYDEISVPILLDKLDQVIKPTLKRQNRFDESTKQQILSLFSFIALGGNGISQADNDVVSSYIARPFNCDSINKSPKVK